MAKAKNNFYAYSIPEKNQSGIVNSWAECESIVKGVNARFKGFPTRKDAEDWLSSGARYEAKAKQKVDILPGIYFDAGTGRGEGVEVSVTDENGADLLSNVLEGGLINKHGKHLLSKEKTNNYGELLACKLALQIAGKLHIKNVFGDSKLIIDYWSRGFIKKNELPKETVSLAMEVMTLRKRFEKDEGAILFISGDYNPADLGFHK